MKSPILIMIVACLSFVQVHALVVNEVMSNPTGDDSGREWIELYNDASEDVDISSLTLSIKGGNPIAVTPLQGGTTLSPGGYAVIGSTVSGQTRFLQDYPNYSGLLLKSPISLVNTGSTSIDVKSNGSTLASLPSYMAAKEGTSLSFFEGTYGSGTPTPGAQNSALESSPDTSGSSSTTTTTSSQVTLPQLSPPSPDITMYLPEEKTVVAGAESEYTVFSLTRAGKSLSDLRYTWAFGDGGQANGSSTKYTYLYPGRYIAQVEGSNVSVFGTARMMVRVVAPDLSISSVGSDRYGTYVDVHNPNPYPLELSQWGFSIDGAFFPFPKNTMILPQETTRFSGRVMGFASTTITASTSVRILFPNNEEVTRYVPQLQLSSGTATVVFVQPRMQPAVPIKKNFPQRTQKVLGAATSTVSSSTTQVVHTRLSEDVKPRDTRIISWLKALFQ